MVPYLASVFGIFLIRQYVAGRARRAAATPRAWTAPASSGSSAPIVVPVIKPILVTLAAFTFLQRLERLHVAADHPERQRASTRCRWRWPTWSGEHVQDTELMMAGSVLTILPALVVFLLFQRAYVRGIMAGSVKG